MDAISLCKLLNTLEEQKDAVIAEFRLYGWSLWPRFRYDVVHRLDPSRMEEEQKTRVRPNLLSRWRPLRLATRSFVQLLALTLSPKVGRVVTRTYTYSRREWINGQKFCIYTDPLIMLLGPERFIASESRGYPKDEYEKNVPFPIIFYDDFVLIFASVLRPFWKTLHRKEIARLKKVAAQIDFLTAPSVPELASTFATQFWIWKSVYRILKPRAVVIAVPNNGREPEMAALKTLGIPVIEYQHGDITPQDFGYSYSAALLPQRPHLPIPDKIFLFSETQKETCLENGFWQTEDLEVTGVPRLSLEQKKDQHLFPFEANFRNVLVSSSVIPGVREDLQRFLENYVKKSPYKEVRFYVKPHPSENIEKWRGLAQQFPGRIFLPEEPIHLLMKNADIQMGIYTTCLQEGLIWKLPIYVLKGAIWELSKPLVEAGSARLIDFNFEGPFERFLIPPSEQYRYMEPLNVPRLEKLLFE